MEKFLDVQDPKLSQIPLSKIQTIHSSHNIQYLSLPHKKRGAISPSLLRNPSIKYFGTRHEGNHIFLRTTYISSMDNPFRVTS